MRNFLITGKPGSGKSTLIQKLMDRYKDRNISGIVTPDMRRGHKRYGFKIIDIASGNEEILASVDVKSDKKVSKYGVDMEAIGRIMDKWMESFEDAGIFMVDEIGKMELYSEKFKRVVRSVLDSDKPVIATIQMSRDPFCEKIKKRGDSEVLFLTKENKDEIFDKITSALDSAVS
ncbi:MAG: NTPase [Candidatus Aminicenantes bacterium]